MPTKKALQHSPHRPTQLYRSETNRIIGGVAGGLGEYFEIDPVIVRIFFVLAAVWGGAGIIMYLILWAVIPSQSEAAAPTGEHIRANVGEMRTKAESFAREIRGSEGPDNSRQWWGIVLLAVGGLFLLGNFGIIHPGDIGRFWPLILIASGFILLARR